MNGGDIGDREQPIGTYVVLSFPQRKGHHWWDWRFFTLWDVPKRHAFGQELLYELPSCSIPSCPWPNPVTNGYTVEEKRLNRESDEVDGVLEMGFKP